MFMNIIYRFLESHGHHQPVQGYGQPVQCHDQSAQTHVQSTETHGLHPFIDTWSHQISNANMLREVRFPDVKLDGGVVLLLEGDFTLLPRPHLSPHHSQRTQTRTRAIAQVAAAAAAGRPKPNKGPGAESGPVSKSVSVSVSKSGSGSGSGSQQHQAKYDIITTYFFIDTAHNLLTYLDALSALLPRGGIWLNLGPLLYGTAPAVSLSLQDIIAISETIGFEFFDIGEDRDFITGNHYMGRDDGTSAGVAAARAKAARAAAHCGRPTFHSNNNNNNNNNNTSFIRTVHASYAFDREALSTSSYKAQFWVARKR